MIINASYFQNKQVYIPNSVAQPSIGSNTPNAVDTLNAYIDEKERVLLLSILGYDQLTELLDQFDTNGDWKGTALQKWKDLVDGKDKWKGLRYTIGTNKYSLIASYVFFYYLGDDFTTYTTTGVVSSDAENSSFQTPNAKQTSAWNSFVKMYNGFNVKGFPCTTFQNWNGQGIMFNNSQNNEISLYDFMKQNNNVYDVSYFTTYGLVNSWGL